MDEKGTAPTDQRFGGERPTIARTISALRLGAAALSLAVSVTLAGCAGGDSPMPAGQNFTKDQSDRFVVASRDLPPGYKKVGSESGPVKCDSGHLANQGAPTETGGEAVVRERLLALGAQGCHVSVYEERSDDGNSTSGFRVLAVVFPDPEAASRSLALFRASLSDPLLTESWAEAGETPPPAEAVPALGLGDESAPGIKRAVVLGPHTIGPVTLDHFWRVRNVAVVLSGSGVEDVVEFDAPRIAESITARAVG